MLLKIMRNRRGMTMAEVMVVCGLLSIILLGTMAVFMGSLDYWQKGVSSSAADSNAGIAAQKLVREIEEGSSASLSSGRLVVVFPSYDATNGLYDRSLPGQTVTYYRSGATGIETNGTMENLWKRVGTTRTLVMRGVSSVQFTLPNSRTVTITLTGKAREGSKQNTSPSVVTKVRLRN